jgi:hypothetical protein
MSYNSKERSITLDDLNSFDLYFDAVLDNAAFFDCFTSFLELSLNADKAQFLTDVNEYRKLRSENKKLVLAKFIYNKFISEESEYELNIQDKARNLINESITSRSYLPKTLFDTIEAQILITLKEHLWHRFLASEHFKKNIVKQPLSLLYDIGTTKNNTLMYYLDHLGDMRDICFNIDDFRFLKTQLSNFNMNRWECLGSNDNYSCYYSKDTYDLGSSERLNFFKYYVTIPYPVDDCYNTFKELHHRISLDKNLVAIDQLDYIAPTNEHETYTSITREEYKLTWPFKNREFIVSTSGIYDKQMYIIGMKTSAYEEKVKPKHKVIRCPSIGGWTFQAIDDRTTQYCQLHYIDFKGNVPKSIMKILLHKRAKRFQKAAMKQIKLFIGKVSTNDNSIHQTILDNKRLVSSIDD